MGDPLIVLVVRRYHPEWEPPTDNGKPWQACLCPFHGDTTKSAAVSYDLDAFRCQACDAKGNAITLIKNQEGLTFADAKRLAEGLALGSGEQIPAQSPRKPSRRVFGE